MLSLSDEIRMVEKELTMLNKELALMDPKAPENRFKYANKQSEINCLNKKLYQLRERQKQINKSTIKGSIREVEDKEKSTASIIQIGPVKKKEIKKGIKKY